MLSACRIDRLVTGGPMRKILLIQLLLLLFPVVRILYVDIWPNWLECLCPSLLNRRGLSTSCIHVELASTFSRVVLHLGRGCSAVQATFDPCQLFVAAFKICLHRHPLLPRCCTISLNVLQRNQHFTWPLQGRSYVITSPNQTSVLLPKRSLMTSLAPS